MEVTDLKMIKIFSKAITREYVALSGFAQYMQKKCKKATSLIEEKEAFIRRLYWFTRQAYRNPSKFSSQVGPALFDQIKNVNMTDPQVTSSNFALSYVANDLEAILFQASEKLMMVYASNDKSDVQYDRWELRNFGKNTEICYAGD